MRSPSTIRHASRAAGPVPADEPAAGARTDVELRGVRKSFGGNTAVDGLDLAVARGEFLTLLGPSGCGKTTTLNIIAGFVEPDVGEVMLGGREVSRLPANKRDSAMVFQQYALFPHMTVADNVAFGLTMRRVKRAEIERRVAEALDVVGLPGLGRRFPRQLSGGQQQRVALARAIVVRPTVLLLDEPLSNLDLKLREQLRLEIRHLQREVGITTVFVTHDQAEALVMSDRIAVLNAGRIEQLGTPADIYQRPVNSFVAGFIGQSNLLPGELVACEGGTAAIRLAGGELVRAPAGAGAERPSRVSILVRPEAFRLRTATTASEAAGTDRPGPEAGVNALRGTVREVVYLGSCAHVLVDIANPASAPPPTAGAAALLSVPVGECRVLAS
jgi:ABC-type Fe3+/spermidine/putrescine transport system ATPase subunit